MNKPSYPFSAVVGQESMKLALKAVAVDPEIGGVLVKGPRGTGKSTLSRSLAEILPDQRYRTGCPLRCSPDTSGSECPFCGDEFDRDVETGRPRFEELPLGATPDQVIGSLNINEALNEGRKRLDPGLLARAHRGILYVDEVNLLPDRLVDLLLDVAASGVNRVEREGLSVEHPAEFILIGTMNPDEGRLRPQLRDRFGLSVRADNQTDPERRQELARRASAFKTDPDSFREKWLEEQRDLRELIVEARNRLSEVTFNEGQEEWIAHRVLDSGAEGHRADIVVRRTARALAALRDRLSVHQEDLEEAFEMAIEHRRSPDPGGGGRPPRTNSDESPFEGETETNGEEADSGETVIESRRTEIVSLPSRTNSPETRSSNTVIGPASDWKPGNKLNVIKTLRNFLNRDLADDRRTSIQSEDVVLETARNPDPLLRLWVLDTSASMARKKTIGLVKSVVKNQLTRRSERWTSLVDFRGGDGSTVVPPTRKKERLLAKLDGLPVAGETPMVEGLNTARNVLESFRTRHHGARVRVVLVSDGRVSLTGGLLRSLELLKNQAELTLVDAELESTDWGIIGELSKRLGVPSVSLRDRVA